MSTCVLHQSRERVVVAGFTGFCFSTIYLNIICIARKWLNRLKCIDNIMDQHERQSRYSLYALLASSPLGDNAGFFVYSRMLLACERYYRCSRCTQ